MIRGIQSSGQNGEGVLYLRERQSGALWSGAGWVVTRGTGRAFNRVADVMAAARALDRTGLEVVMVFAGAAGEMAIPLDPPDDVCEA